MLKSKITRNYQVTLPREIREKMGFRVGDEIVFAAEGDKVSVMKYDRKAAIEATAGLWKNTEETGLEYTRRVRAGWRKRQY